MRRVTAATAASLVFALLLGGCAAPRYDATVASALQEQVGTITAASAEGEWQSAITQLMALEADARDARARELISVERLESIIAAIELVRVSLESELAAEEAAAADEAAAAERAEREAQAEAERQREIEAAAAEARRIAAEEAERRAAEEAERERQEQEEEEEKKNRGKDKDEDDDDDDD